MDVLMALLKEYWDEIVALFDKIYFAIKAKVLED